MASYRSRQTCPETSKTALIPATMYIKLPRAWDSFSGRRPSSDLFAVTDRILMRAFPIVSVFQTQRLAHKKTARLCAICLVIATCFGCGKKGPQRAAASGHVTLDGQPIDQGVIQFLPVEGTIGPETGGVISKGQYDILKQRGPIVGKSRIELRA